jgi:hypothetical protein
MAALPVKADTVLDYIESEKLDHAEVYTLHFNTPVQYLYHTPEKNTDHTLIALFIQQTGQLSSSDTAQHIPRPKSDWLEDIEFFAQFGFNSHLYLKLSTSVDIQVKTTADFRSLVIKVTKNSSD